MDRKIEKYGDNTKIGFDSTILEKYKLPDFKKVEYFEYRDQFYDSDAFRDIQEWSKFVAKFINQQNQQIRICFNGLVDTITENERIQIEMLNGFIREVTQKLKESNQHLNGVIESVNICKKEINDIKQEYTRNKSIINDIKQECTRNKSIINDIKQEYTQNKSINSKNTVFLTISIINLALILLIIGYILFKN